VIVEGRLPPEVGAVLRRALEAAKAEGVSAETPARRQVADRYRTNRRLPWPLSRPVFAVNPTKSIDAVRHVPCIRLMLTR
jgi:hypothetical protein